MSTAAVEPTREMQTRDQVVDAAYTALCADGGTVDVVAARYGVSVAEIQSHCAAECGHEWTHWSAGDGPWFQAGSDYCEICGVDRDCEYWP